VTCDPGPDATITVRDDIEVTASLADESGALRRLFWQEGATQRTYVDSTSLSGATATVTYAISGRDAIWFIIGGYPMMAWVACRDGRLSVPHRGPSIAAFRDVTITGTNAPVRAGDDLIVDAEIAIDGDSTYHAFVEGGAGELIVGHDPTHVDSETVEVFAGNSETVQLAFTTATVRNTQTFPVRVETRHAASETDVTVIGTDDESHGHLEVTGLETNAPVTGGEWLEVTATLENTADGPASRDVKTRRWGRPDDGRHRG